MHFNQLCITVLAFAAFSTAFPVVEKDILARQGDDYYSAENNGIYNPEPGDKAGDVITKRQDDDDSPLPPGFGDLPWSSGS